MRARAEPEELPSPRRRAVVGAVLSVLVCGHLACFLLVKPDLWPFSAYPMFSRPPEPAFLAHFPVGVLEEGREIELWREWEHMRPLSLSDVQATFERLTGEGAPQALLEEAAADLLLRYEARRQRGAHGGPPLRALRIYAHSWRIDPAHPRRAAPIARRLVVEVQRPEAAR